MRERKEGRKQVFLNQQNKRVRCSRDSRRWGLGADLKYLRARFIIDQNLVVGFCANADAFGARWRRQISAVLVGPSE